MLGRRETFRYTPGKKSALQPKAERFLTTCLTCVAAVVSTVFSVYYSYTVLVNEDAVPPALSLSPGKTVMVINVLSHVVAFLCWSLLSDASEALRWALACRPQGISLASFLALSRATTLPGVAYLCTVWGEHILWGLQRIVSMAIVTLLGLVLITDVTFKNIYTASPTALPVPVMAGLAPLSIEFLPYMPPALINVYAATYSAGFLTDPRFVADIPPVKCSGQSCSSVFLPGGLHTVRLANGNRNSTLFGGGYNWDYESILVNQAPGYQVEFDSLPTDYLFEEEDCKLYMDQIGLPNYGLYVCLAEDGLDLLAGWTICPRLEGVGNCGHNTTWTRKHPMDQSTIVYMHKRYATVAYDRHNMSILTIERLSAPVRAPIPASIIRTYFDIVLAPQPSLSNSSSPAPSLTAATAADACTSYTVQYGIGWILTLYKQDFSDYVDGGLAIMRGFLAIPLQFSTEIWQQADMRSLPADLAVHAQLSRVSYRAIIAPWTVYVFAATAAAVLGWSIGCLGWCLVGPYTPNASYFPEIDITSKGTSPAAGPKSVDGSLAADRRSAGGSGRGPGLEVLPREGAEEGLEDLEYLTRKMGLGNGMSREVVRGIKGKLIYCGAYLGELGDADHIVIVTERGRVGPLCKKEKYC